MDHRYIEDQHIPQRYLAGKLSTEDAAEFEEHYLHCQECLERLELAGSLRRGLRQLATGELARAAVLTRAGRFAQWRFGRSFPAWLVVTFVLAAALLPSFYFHRQLARAAGALQEEHRPRVNTQILSLSPSRSADTSTPENRVTLSGSAEWFTLILDVASASVEVYPSHRVSLRTTDQKLVWQSSDLVANELGALVIQFHSSFPGPGDYLISVEGMRPAGDGVFLAPFSLRIAEGAPAEAR